jgi:hypothetical protein
MAKVPTRDEARAAAKVQVAEYSEEELEKARGRARRRTRLVIAG